MIQTVKYSTLCDGNNVKDPVFSNAVRKFMDQFMPGGPMGLLDTDAGAERWEIQPGKVHSVEAVTWPVEGEEEEPPMDGYAIRNDNTGERLTANHSSLHQNYADNLSPCPDHEVDIEDDTDVQVWNDEDEALQAAKEADSAYDSEHGYENRYGYPWAQSWWYRPDDVITDDDLKAAGFVVATYTGGKGDFRNDEQFRLCGIDGGGYGFKEAHFAPLCVIVSERLEWPIETSQGRVLVTRDERTDLEMLASAEQP